MLTVDLRDAPDKLRKAKTVALFGNGGNMAVAQHMASDIFPDLEKIYPVRKAIHDHDTWMDDPMSPKRKLKLKYYVDKVLCSL